MIKIEKTEVTGWEAAIRGMRNPKNSWVKSDSMGCPEAGNCEGCDMFIPETSACRAIDPYSYYILGRADKALMMQLASGGPVHAKYRRMITVYMDITAPLYWWKEFDTYKVGTVANSCSTMHKIHDKEFTMDDFSHEHLDGSLVCSYYGEEVYSSVDILTITIRALNTWREKYLTALKTEEACGLPAKDIWWQMIQLLPSSYNQKRTIMLNYEVLAGIYPMRKNHKLDEWHTFCDWIKSLPYSEIITGEVGD